MSRFEKDLVILGIIVIIVIAMISPKGEIGAVPIYLLPAGFFFALAGLSFFLRYCAGIKSARRAWYGLWN